MGWIPCCGDSDDESSEIMEKIPLQETIYDPIKVKNPESLLGEGIYKGHLESFNQVVAIKNKNELQKDREFIHELLTSTLHHPNIVNPIHEYMSLGSLEEHLHDLAPGKKPLDWNTRMKIACGVANGLKYLHNKTEPPIIHRDLKCSNILLGEGYHPKLSGFGFARIIGPDGENTYVFTRDRQVMGSIGYCDPEHVKTGLLTPKSDVYSFGVVLLETITGRKAVDDSEPIESVNLVAWARPLFVDIKRKYSKMADPMLQGQYPRRRLLQAIAVAAMCVLDQPQVRPGIADVCVALEHIASQTYDPIKHGVQSHSSLNKPV